MATDHRKMPVPGPGLVSAEERVLLAESIAAWRGKEADPDELEAVVDWVTRSRVNYRLTEHVLDGILSVRFENGAPLFRGRTLLDTPLQ